MEPTETGKTAGWTAGTPAGSRGRCTLETPGPPGRESLPPAGPPARGGGNAAPASNEAGCLERVGRETAAWRQWYSDPGRSPTARPLRAARCLACVDTSANLLSRPRMPGRGERYQKASWKVLHGNDTRKGRPGSRPQGAWCRRRDSNPHG